MTLNKLHSIMTVTGKVTKFYALSVKNINRGYSQVDLWKNGKKNSGQNKFMYTHREERDAVSQRDSQFTAPSISAWRWNSSKPSMDSILCY